jgi:hypothetical protein
MINIPLPLLYSITMGDGLGVRVVINLLEYAICGKRKAITPQSKYILGQYKQMICLKKKII